MDDDPLPKSTRFIYTHTHNPYAQYFVFFCFALKSSRLNHRHRLSHIHLFFVTLVNFMYFPHFYFFFYFLCRFWLAWARTRTQKVFYLLFWGTKMCTDYSSKNLDACRFCESLDAFSFHKNRKIHRYRHVLSPKRRYIWLCAEYFVVRTIVHTLIIIKSKQTKMLHTAQTTEYRNWVE